MNKALNSGRLLRILDVAQDWKDTALSLIDDIEGWRDHTASRLSRSDDPRGGWPEQQDASKVWSNTSMLDQYLMEFFPDQSTDAILDVCEWCQTWLIEKSAESLPPSTIMWIRADRAVIVVNRLVEWCMNQLTPHIHVERNELEEICLTGPLVSELTDGLLTADAFAAACRRSSRDIDNSLGAFKNDKGRWAAPILRIRSRWSEYAHLITHANLAELQS